MLAEQPFRLLVMLVEREGQIATREEIRKSFWPNDTIVEFDHSINVVIGKLRKALGDSADEPKYIETLARRGYRLMVPVEWLGTDGPSTPEAAPSFRARLAKGACPEPAEGWDTTSVLLGKKVSHYRVLEIIGAGGMGLVYKAEDLKLGRQVALKFLPQELASDSVALQRFEREAQTASSLNHPNICTIYEVEEHEGQPFLVMELLQGGTLRDRLASPAANAVPLDQLLNIATQICDGLQAAHERGIVHRDIKPANLFLTASGQVKILDFGLAKLVVAGEKEQAAAAMQAQGGGNRGDHGRADLQVRVPQPLPIRPLGPEVRPSIPVSGLPKSADDTLSEDNPSASFAGLKARSTLQPATGLQLTRTGLEMGTAGYMSPEQVRGEKLDTRTDIFSFGLVLYEIATGQRAFSGETAAIVHDSILHNSPVPVRELNPTLPARLVATIDKCLEKDRTRRFQSAAEVRTALQEMKRGAANKASGRMRTAWAAAVLVLTALAIGLYLRRASHAPHLGSVSSSLQVRQLTESGKSYRAAATPDGSYVAYVKKEAGKYELRLLQVATERDLQLLPGAPQRINGLHFSRDGNFLYFLRVLDPSKDPYTSGVFRIGTLGGPVTTLATDARTVDERSNSVTVSPDGKQIAYIAQAASESLIVAIDPDGSDRRVLAKRPLAGAFWFVEWSPSQDTLAAVADLKDGMVLFRIDLPAWLNARPERIWLDHRPARVEFRWRYHLRSCRGYEQLDHADMGV